MGSGRVGSGILLCTGARIGDANTWADRIAQVSASGTPAIVAASAERWFGPGFLDREPDRGSALLDALQEADDEGYSRVCRVLSEFDVRDRLAEIHVPVLAIAGSLAAKKSVPPSAGTFPTTGALFIGLLVGVILIVGGLTFFPALALGPVVEHLAMINGTLY